MTRIYNASGKMKVQNVSLIALTVWAVVGSYLALILMGTALFTNRWIYTTETIERDFRNGTLRVISDVHSGLFVWCRDKVSYKWVPHPSDISKNVSEASLRKLAAVQDELDCYFIRENMPKSGEPPKDINSAVLAHVVKVLPWPMFAFILLLVTCCLSTLGLFVPQRRCIMFLNGDTHILAGLCSLTGLIRYIIAVNDAVIEKHPVSSEKLFFHTYAVSFVVAVLAFFTINSTGVASLYLYIRLEKMAVRSEQDRYRHHQLVTMSSCVTSSPENAEAGGRGGPVVSCNAQCAGGDDHISVNENVEQLQPLRSVTEIVEDNLPSHNSPRPIRNDLVNKHSISIEL